MRIAARLFITLLAVAAFLPPERTAAQAVFGSIYGTVTDSSGAAVPGATVTITDVAKNITFNETTNDLGYFNRAKLVLGRYRVEIQKEGFKTAVQEDVAVNVDVSNALLTIVLQAGTVTEQVTVTAEAPLLKSDRADVATTFEQKEFSDLPTIDRNFTRFELLTPGTARCCAGWDHAASENPQGITADSGQWPALQWNILPVGWNRQPRSDSRNHRHQSNPRINIRGKGHDPEL